MMSRDGSDYSATDREMDRLVYELYGLTEEEVRIRNERWSGVVQEI